MYFLVHSSAIQAARTDYNDTILSWECEQTESLCRCLWYNVFSLPLSANVHTWLKKYDWFDSESTAMEFFKDKNAV